MKPSKLGTPERDLGWAEIRPFAESLIRELERQAKNIQALDERQPGRREPPASGLAEARRLLGNLALRTGDAVTLERQRVLHRALDEIYMTVSLAAGRVTVFAGGVATVPNGDANVLRFAPGALGAVERQEPMRQLWVRTRPRIDVLYTSPVGAVAAFSFRLLLRAFGAGLTTTAAPLVLNWTAAGPAVANTILLTTAYLTVAPVWSSPIGSVGVRLTRPAPDANPNDLDVLLAVVTFEEVA